MEENFTKIEHELPLIPLRGSSIFPHMVLNFDVGRDISIKALDKCIGTDDLVFLSSQKNLDIDNPLEDDFYKVGTICKIKQIIKLPGNAIRVLAEGVSRGKVKSLEFLEEGYYKAVIEEIILDEDNLEEDIEIDGYIRNITASFEEYIGIGNRISPEILLTIENIDSISKFADVIASNIALKLEQKQEILEEFDIKKRLELYIKY